MDFVKLMQRWDNNPLKLQLPEDLEARPIALQFLAHSLADWNDDVQHLHIYTDGSFSPDMQVASFSFAVFWLEPFSRRGQIDFQRMACRCRAHWSTRSELHRSFTSLINGSRNSWSDLESYLAHPKRMSTPNDIPLWFEDIRSWCSRSFPNWKQQPPAEKTETACPPGAEGQIWHNWLRTCKNAHSGCPGNEVVGLLGQAEN